MWGRPPRRTTHDHHRLHPRRLRPLPGADIRRPPGRQARPSGRQARGRDHGDRRRVGRGADVRRLLRRDPRRGRIRQVRLGPQRVARHAHLARHRRERLGQGVHRGCLPVRRRRHARDRPLRRHQGDDQARRRRRLDRPAAGWRSSVHRRRPVRHHLRRHVGPAARGLTRDRRHHLPHPSRVREPSRVAQGRRPGDAHDLRAQRRLHHGRCRHRQRLINPRGWRPLGRYPRPG